MSSGELIPTPEVANRAVNVVVYGDKNRVKVKDSVIQTLEMTTSDQSRLRRLIEVTAGLAAIGGSALLLILNWDVLFG